MLRLLSFLLLTFSLTIGIATAQTYNPELERWDYRSDIKFTGTFKLPTKTTTQRNALTAAEGMVIYNTTLDSVQVYRNSSWVSVGDGTGTEYWTVADFGGVDILYPVAAFDRFALTKDENRFGFDGSSITSRSDTIIFEVNSSKSYRFPSDTGSVGQVLGVSVNAGAGATTLAWVDGITLQDSIVSQKDTAGLAAELASLPEALSVIQNLIARVLQLENRLQLVGILPEEE